MPSFRSAKDPVIVVTVSDREEVQLCPKCTFPNNAAARECVECGHQLQDGSGRWVVAKFVRKCSDPVCSGYVCTKDAKCKKCGASTRQEASILAPEPASATQAASYVLVCPNCNTHNPANADICSQCCYSLEDVDPVCESETQTLTVQLENIRTQKRATLSLQAGQGMLVGRNGALADQFANTGYVSGKHFYLFYDKGSLWIRDESRNGTYIEGKRLNKGVATTLASDTIVGLGDPSASERLAAFFKITY